LGNFQNPGLATKSSPKSFPLFGQNPRKNDSKPERTFLDLSYYQTVL
jgi:hypothetical protein